MGTLDFRLKTWTVFKFEQLGWGCSVVFLSNALYSHSTLYVYYMAGSASRQDEANPMF